jgi:hypothetical protein
MATRCDVLYGTPLESIDGRRRLLRFAGGSELAYETVICTLSLHQAMVMAGLRLSDRADPFTSVLVHRIGFHSNVDAGFLPLSGREDHSRVARVSRRLVAPSE